MATQGPNPNQLARASGNANNCGFHCLIHAWLHLSSEKREEVMKRPVFFQIQERFNRYYGLPESQDLSAFMQLIESYEHPFDRELLLGSVLRDVLRDHLLNDNAKKQELQGNNMVPDDTLAILANAMGAELKIGKAIQNSDQVVYLPYSNDNQTYDWQVTMLHRGPDNSGHYDLVIDDPKYVQAHNQKMTVTDSLSQGAKNPADAQNLFYRYYDSAQERSKQIKAQVQNRAKALTANIQDRVNLFTLRQSPKAALDLDSPSTRVGFRSPQSQNAQSTPSLIATPQAKPQPAPDDKVVPEKKPQTPEAITQDFASRLKQVFSEANWQHQSENHDIKITKKGEESHWINIREENATMIFTSAPNAIDSLVKAADTYQDYLKEQQQEVEFQLSAATDQQAAGFLKDLKKNGFDTNKIQMLKIGGKTWNQEESQKWLSEHQEKLSPKPKPKP